MSTVEAIPTRANAEAFIRRTAEFWKETRGDLRRRGWPAQDVDAVLGGIELALSRGLAALDAKACDDDVYQRTIEIADIGRATVRVVASFANIDPKDIARGKCRG